MTTIFNPFSQYLFNEYTEPDAGGNGGGQPPDTEPDIPSNLLGVEEGSPVSGDAPANDEDNETPKYKPIPETADDYTPILRKGIELDASMTPIIKAAGHKHGIPQEVIGEVLSDIIEAQGGLVEQEQKASLQEREKAYNGLKEEWGLDFEKKAKAASQAAQKLAAQAGVSADFLNDPAIGGNINLVRIMAKAAEIMGEGKMKGADAPTGQNTDEAFQIMHDKSHPLHAAFHDTSSPMFSQANKEYNRLVGIEN